MEPLLHECGVAMIRLRKPLNYYQEKYGTWAYGMNKLFLLMNKQYNRGQQGAGIACVKLKASPGEDYMFRERAEGSGAISEVFDYANKSIGGLFASTACIMGFELMLAIVGIMFVISALSVILQVAYFKKTKGKRIFKMAPIHHHFQMSGYSEAKIGYIYQVITLMIGLVTIMLTLLFI